MRERGDLAAAGSAQQGDPEAPLCPWAWQPPRLSCEQLGPVALLADPRPKDAGSCPGWSDRQLRGFGGRAWAAAGAVRICSAEVQLGTHVKGPRNVASNFLPRPLGQGLGLGCNSAVGSWEPSPKSQPRPQSN